MSNRLRKKVKGVVSIKCVTIEIEELLKCGEVKSTKGKEIILIFYEAFKSERDARRREEYFKTTKGKRALKIMLKETINEVSGPVV